MNVCILGERSDQLDEGMKNFSVQLQTRLQSRGLESRLLDLREIGRGDFWKTLFASDPDVVHLVPGPTCKGLLLLRILAVSKRCQTVATVTQPRFSALSEQFISYLGPSLVFAQSESSRREFERFGCSTKLLPSGVDLDRFTPPTESTVSSIRTELGLPADDRLFLHIGHFKRGRGLESLLELQQYGHVVIVGSPSTGPQESLVQRLETAGVTVRSEYIPHIEKFYQAADVYVFPVLDDGNSIQAPLSVFEAMACNLPVVSTRFGGLPDFFEEGDGLRFVSSFADVAESTFEFTSVACREKVRPYSWDAIVRQTLEAYENLCNAGH